MGNWKRKQQRKGKNKTRCCGEQMTYKSGYGYVCKICGKAKAGEQE